ncbi:MAG: radical SAM protein [Desulfobacteraceae bacterium]|nr:radical SAM protein [Desulfobacteraceae bacterium]
MKEKHPRAMPCLVYANSRGEIVDFPELAMAGRSGSRTVQPALADLIPLPEGSELFVLPGRLPVGTDPATGEPLKLAENPGEPEAGIQAVAAFMAPAHTAIHTAAFEKTTGAPLLPLFAYTAVGWLDGRFWAAGFRSDADPRQEAAGFDCRRIEKATRQRLSSHPANRLIQHLGICSLTYSCPAAKNYFLDRYEAPLPTSPACNARCLGCISLQPSGCCPSTQERIKFVPTPAEIAEVAVPHLERVARGVVSFGQGCEGEPLLQADTIEEAIRLIRKSTGRGTVNLNSNASLPDKVARLAAAGLDSIRVSLNSARPECHARYYRPQGFTFADVCGSIDAMKAAGKFVSLNYFILPGFTDDPEELAALCDLVSRHRPDFIQLRNLNMDPDWYLEALGHRPEARPLGIRAWLAALKKRFPKLRFGYFNPPLR